MIERLLAANNAGIRSWQFKLTKPWQIHHEFVESHIILGLGLGCGACWDATSISEP